MSIKTLLKHKLYLFALCILLLILNIILLKVINFKLKPICDKCNVILISLDTLSALHLPCYGYLRNTAPNLCSFAKKNILFINSYSESNYTLPSHFSILTSLYPNVHKMTDILGPPLDEKYITLAQVFRQNGYQTIINIVPNDVLELPLNKGIARGFNIIQEPNKNNLWSNSYPELIKSAEEHRPFFAFFHTYYVHSPYTTGHELKHMFTNQPENPNIPLTSQEFQNVTPEFLQFVSYDAGKKFNLYSNIGKSINNQGDEILQKIIHTKNIQELYSLFYSLPPIQQWAFFGDYYAYRTGRSEVGYLQALYDEQIYNLDKKLKGLFDFINKDPRLKNNTIVIITADHGEEFMEHGSLQHGLNLYKTNTLVPLIMHIPGIQAKTITDLVQGIDIYPTVLGITGIKSLSPIQGLNLTGLIRGEKDAKTNQFVLSQANEHNGTLNYFSIQSKNWRMYYHSTNNLEELYNLSLDPEEKNNLAALNKDKINELLQLLTSK